MDKKARLEAQKQLAAIDEEINRQKIEGRNSPNTARVLLLGQSRSGATVYMANCHPAESLTCALRGPSLVISPNPARLKRALRFPLSFRHCVRGYIPCCGPKISCKK
ncbi:hypothetical protein BDZ97DRAFT_1296694 [Flammula alnicola]|nr:hypothetical protein BDZ97DRAFT_1296694 [Flammula alnicola]